MISMNLKCQWEDVDNVRRKFFWIVLTYVFSPVKHWSSWQRYWVLCWSLMIWWLNSPSDFWTKFVHDHLKFSVLSCSFQTKGNVLTSIQDMWEEMKSFVIYWLDLKPHPLNVSICPCKQHSSHLLFTSSCFFLSLSSYFITCSIENISY